MLNVLEHQNAIETEQTELDKYQALIEDQKSKISAASVKEDKVAPFIRHREDVFNPKSDRFRGCFLQNENFRD